MALSAELEDFCRREYPRLVQTLTLYCGESEKARGLAHVALGRACARWSTVQKVNSPSAWVNRLGMKLAGGRVGQRRPPVPASGPKLSGMPRRDVAGAAALRRAVSSLPPRQRTALLLRHFLRLSAFEAAELMDCDARAVRKLTRKAMEQLRHDPEVQRFAEVVDGS